MDKSKLLDLISSITDTLDPKKPVDIPAVRKAFKEGRIVLNEMLEELKFDMKQVTDALELTRLAEMMMDITTKKEVANDSSPS